MEKGAGGESADDQGEGGKGGGQGTMCQLDQWKRGSSVGIDSCRGLSRVGKEDLMLWFVVKKVWRKGS